jgi:hypothetical protein
MIPSGISPGNGAQVGVDVGVGGLDVAVAVGVGGTGVAVAVAVAVGGTGVAVGGIAVAVAVGGTAVAVGGTAVAVGGGSVATATGSGALQAARAHNVATRARNERRTLASINMVYLPDTILIQSECRCCHGQRSAEPGALWTWVAGENSYQRLQHLLECTSTDTGQHQIPSPSLSL